MSKLIEKQSVVAGAGLPRDPAAGDSKQAFRPVDGARMDMVISDTLAAIATGVITAGALFALGCYEIRGDTFDNKDDGLYGVRSANS